MACLYSEETQELVTSSDGSYWNYDHPLQTVLLYSIQQINESEPSYQYQKEGVSDFDALEYDEVTPFLSWDVTTGSDFFPCSNILPAINGDFHQNIQQIEKPDLSCQVRSSLVHNSRYYDDEYNEREDSDLWSSSFPVLRKGDTIWTWDSNSPYSPIFWSPGQGSSLKSVSQCGSPMRSNKVPDTPEDTSTEETLRGRRPSIEPDNARDHKHYQNAVVGPDKLYHCPYEDDASCNHKPEKLKCNYDKNVDSHLKPYRCKVLHCETVRFSSTACLLRHEREAHAMHGHGDKPFLCKAEGCERGLPGEGFPRHWNLLDHMKRVHNRSPSPVDGKVAPVKTGKKRKSDAKRPAPAKKNSNASRAAQRAEPIVVVPRVEEQFELRRKRIVEKLQDTNNTDDVIHQLQCCLDDLRDTT